MLVHCRKSPPPCVLIEPYMCTCGHVILFGCSKCIRLYPHKYSPISTQHACVHTNTHSAYVLIHPSPSTHTHTNTHSSHGMPEYRCPREVSTVLCIHDVECIKPDCSGHGSCELGLCSCDPPWTGEGCERLNCSMADCNKRGECTEEGGVSVTESDHYPTN